mmetsp:Transcript_12238/g.28293  ORF Transcript_12238/g.28293 Transcript_12238/m.28293 type:complete len:245 (-) Transcript_12238:675-1409(-)
MRCTGATLPPSYSSRGTWKTVWPRATRQSHSPARTAATRQSLSRRRLARPRPCAGVASGLLRSLPTTLHWRSRLTRPYADCVTRLRRPGTRQPTRSGRRTGASCSASGRSSTRSAAMKCTRQRSLPTLSSTTLKRLTATRTQCFWSTELQRTARWGSFPRLWRTVTRPWSCRSGEGQTPSSYQGHSSAKATRTRDRPRTRSSTSPGSVLASSGRQRQHTEKPTKSAPSHQHWKRRKRRSRRRGW